MTITRRKPLVREFGGPRPIIVVLCGSTRFYREYQRVYYIFTMRGEIVLSVGFYPHAIAENGGHGEGAGHDSSEKIALDELHLRKIDLADRVYVINPGGYTGESTRREIAYAEKLGRPIEYMVPPSRHAPGSAVDDAGSEYELDPADLEAPQP